MSLGVTGRGYARANSGLSVSSLKTTAGMDVISSFSKVSELWKFSRCNKKIFEDYCRDGHNTKISEIQLPLNGIYLLTTALVLRQLSGVYENSRNWASYRMEYMYWRQDWLWSSLHTFHMTYYTYCILHIAYTVHMSHYIYKYMHSRWR